MDQDKERDKLSCSSCGVYNCHTQDQSFPEFCLTSSAGELADEALELYTTEGTTSKIAKAAATIEGKYYGRLTRVEEIIAFAKEIGAKKIGIATCVGLINEAKIFAKILEAKGLESYCVLCKVGSVDKTRIGIPEELKVNKGCFEAACNPVLQAKLLNQEKTDLNVINGLCVGHDSLFIKYSEAPVTNLIVKDRVLGHNPAAALWTSGFYYKRLLQKEE
jgi:uncharacterized metal-binding protein